ncbi:hypothetical protein PXD56_15440 [Maribacter sp. SA7]|uniref:hypothetical protein n=1 Tax=Maribacter zhoushanensis TaxID=3030012 RepID=UPI0023EDC351|nr:hypothetical protein [Maribacter zhoushanensis]MDF4204367.1 hypothetical protein [Maribacter zhoushanensis]
MTGSLISLLSIAMGIIAANIMGLMFKHYSFGVTGNTLIGVFGSILVIQTFGRLGFNAWYIIEDGDFSSSLLTINLVVSTLGGCLALVVAKIVYQKLNNS